MQRLHLVFGGDAHLHRLRDEEREASSTEELG